MSELPLPSRAGWHPAAIKHFRLTKTRGTQKMKFHARMHIAHCLLSLLKRGYKLRHYRKPKSLNAGRTLESSRGLRQYFDVIAASAELGFSPSPTKKSLKKAFELAGCTAEKVLWLAYRLDNDIIPAKAIGMKTVWLKSGLRKYQSAEFGQKILQTIDQFTIRAASAFYDANRN